MEDDHANSPNIVVKPTCALSPEQARDARARAWAFVFECHAKKRGRLADKSGLDDAKEGSNDSRANSSIP